MGSPASALRNLSLKPEHLEQLREYDTALLANLLGYVDGAPAEQWYLGSDIRSLTPAIEPTVGIAVTCEIDTSSPAHQCAGDMEDYWTMLDWMDCLEVPTVWVAKCVGSRPRHECVLGDGMAKTLFSVGCVGVVTDGGVRDLKGLGAIPFSAHATGVTIHHCAMRCRSLGQPVGIGGITVATGELIHAGAEGVIKIPIRSVESLLCRAPQYRAFEHEAHQLLRRRDLRLDERRRRLGELQATYGFTTCDAERSRENTP